MIEAHTIDGLEKSCRFVIDVLGDISKVPGTGALLHNGMDWILGKIRSTIDEYECNRIFSPQVAKQLKIQSEYTMIMSLVTDGLKQVNALRYDDICFESDFFKEAKYNPSQLATSTIHHLESLQEKEYADIHKALEFIFTIYILHWVEQKEFHLSQLTKGLEHEERISKIEQQIYSADNNCGESDNEKSKPGKLSDAHSMHSVTVFNLRCVRNMLEGAPAGQSWAHALRARMNLPDVEFESEIGNRMSIETFPDDADFLGKILPKEILEMLFCGEKNEISVEQIMDGTYSEEIKSRVLEQVVKANCKAIDGIICKCSCLMKRRGWERSFVAAHKAFFAIMGKEVWAFKHDMQACRIFDNMDKGIAMFIVYALLGAERYELLPSITNKPIEKIFR